MKKTIFGYLHTHWDMEWYRNKEDFDIRLCDVVDGIIEELENGNAPFFYFDGQVVALLNYLKIKPQNKNTIIKLIKEKKLAIGPFFVSADTYLTNFISMLKNLEFGIKYSKEFGQIEFIGYICDVFGVSGSVFKALKENNIKNAAVWRGVNPKKINNNCNFIINDINTTWLIQGYFNDFLHSENINIEALKKYLDKISKYSPDNILLPIGADHLGILRNAKDKIKKINEISDDYEIILTSPFEYFKNAKFENTTKEKEFLDNSDTYILGGVYSSRIYQKIQNAKIQNKISRIIEPLNFFLKEKFEANILQAYETLIKNHAHDSICGCSIDSVARCVDYRFEKCNNILNSVKKNIIQNFKLKYSKSNTSKDSIGLFNLSNANNLKTVKIELPYILSDAQVVSVKEKFPDEYLTDIYKIPVTEEIKKHYTQIIEVSKNDKMTFSNVKIIKPKKLTKLTKNSIENDFVKLKTVNKKIIIEDKKKNKLVELFITDIKDDGDTYNFAPKGNYKKFDLISSNILYDGEIQSCLRLKFKDITLDAILNNHSKFIEFKANINNKTKNHKIQTVIKTEKNISKTISQDALGTIERKIDFNYDIRNFMPAKRPFELKTNTYPMQNFVIANNICVLTKGLNEYEIFNDELRICLLRATGTISNPKNPVRAIPAGPNLKIPQAQMIGKNEAEFAITFCNYKDAFTNLDIFYDNYIAVDGCYGKKIIFEKFNDGEIFYGISKKKKIVYNLINKKLR